MEFGKANGKAPPAYQEGLSVGVCRVDSTK